MKHTGDCHDSALVESLLEALKDKWYHRKRLHSPQSTRTIGLNRVVTTTAFVRTTP
ncbi:hypothetical protein [Atopobium sp. oral taxon 416]|uniref:hypothetical protein n=1 Tax=Atopobium sp. oral taxon 416 TaxID=712157 RepID=UPI001BA89B77|nr:hypothetical protein [Atopobium sp. oral taxon 416]QUC02191.1 hypothetical protein J4859_08990 [Atopobium sp. oral taxon 416]